MAGFSKPAFHVIGLFASHVYSCAAAMALMVAINSTRKRRRASLGDISPFRLPRGGRGGTRENRKPPSPRYKNSTGKDAWMFQPERTQFYLNYIENEDLARDPTTVLGREFKAKFRVTYATFKRFVDDTRASGLFVDEKAKKSGQKPHPLAMKVLAALRRLALGIPMDGLADMVGISNTVLNKFIPQSL